MVTSKPYTIQIFNNSFDAEFLKEILILNQTNTPAVGHLNSLDELKELLNKSYINYFIKTNQIIGFMICFKEKSDYSSKNYKFFSDNEESFIYIDRVVIKEEYRRKGIANSFYYSIEQIASKLKSPLCCEVNTFPINEPSLEFHNKFGFLKVGENNFTNNSVAYFKKIYS